MGTSTRTIDRRACDFCPKAEDVTRGPFAEPMRGDWYEIEITQLKSDHPMVEAERRRPVPPGNERRPPWYPLVACLDCMTMAIHSLKRLRAQRTEHYERLEQSQLSVSDQGLDRPPGQSVSDASEAMAAEAERVGGTVHHGDDYVEVRVEPRPIEEPVDLRPPGEVRDGETLDTAYDRLEATRRSRTGKLEAWGREPA